MDIGNKIASEAAKVVTKVVPLWALVIACVGYIWWERRRKRASEKT